MTQITPPSAWWAVAARYLLAFVFLSAAFGKLTSPTQFQSFLTSLGFSSQVYLTVLSFVVVGLEVGVTGLLIYPRTTTLGAISAFGLVFAFTVVLMYASVGMEFTTGCGCFGELVGDDSTDLAILRNVAVLLIAPIIVNRYEPAFRQS